MVVGQEFATVKFDIEGLIHYSYSYSNSRFKGVFNSSFIYQKMLGDVTATIIFCCDKVSPLKFKKGVLLGSISIYFA